MVDFLRVGLLFVFGINLALLCLTLLNTRLLVRPRFKPTTRSVAVLIPARNEQDNIEAATRSALESVGLENFTVMVFDDHSQDRTREILHSIHDDRLQVLLPEQETPQGWLGKPWACHVLSTHATAEILVFLDADVVVEPEAIASAVAALESQGLDFVSPYPKQVAVGILGRLIQPLLQWSWLTFVPLGIAKRSQRPSLAVANGQFIACRREAYVNVGGHERVAHEVIEDVALLRAFLAAGYRGTVIDGTHLATCTMYQSNSDLVNGYAKSLWTAFGGIVGSVFVNLFLLTLFTVPAVLLFSSHWPIALATLLLNVAGRFVVARTPKQRHFPDVFLHPLSIALLAVLNVISWSRHLRKRNTWKGRPIEVG